MDYSILNDTKKLLGFDPSYTAFDTDIIIHINSALMALEQMGVGANNFQIANEDAKWQEFLAGQDYNLESVKTYVYLKVRAIFDPPSTSFGGEALNKQAAEYEWRLYMQAELNKEKGS